MQFSALSFEYFNSFFLFQQGFLHIDEYPPDANQGFDIPSAVVHFADFVANMSFDDNFLKEVPMLSKLQVLKQVIPITLGFLCLNSFDCINHLYSS